MLFFIWLIIVIVIIAASIKKSMRQKNDFRKKKTTGQKIPSPSARRRRAEAPREDILTRSKRNAAETFDDNAAAPVSPASAAEKTGSSADWDEISHSPSSYHIQEPEMDFSALMDTVQDLIVKGYEPKLSFERDFISEGMDFLNKYYYK